MSILYSLALSLRSTSDSSLSTLPFPRLFIDILENFCFIPLMASSIFSFVGFLFFCNCSSIILASSSGVRPSSLANRSFSARSFST
ncbi:hypothetical protein KC340_g29 [Hortaea werneckii]|nr:hypothetical protein KC340_g29 [Hortaea werneckii]